MNLTSEHIKFALKSGLKIGGHYRIVDVIGSGGFGITYSAFDVKNNKAVAVKEYFPSSWAVRKGRKVYPSSERNSEEYRNGLAKFYREAECVSDFNGNPNIVSVFDCFYENNTAYLVMEYISGITLENYIKKHGTLSAEQTVYLAGKLSAALTVIHSAGLLHRDISPDNIMLCGDKIKLVDFGMARNTISETSPMLTVSMKTGFTPAEQYTRNGNFGDWTDIYSLGAVLYFALTGKTPQPPYVRMIDDSEFSESLSNVNRSLYRIIRKTMGISESERYTSSAEMKRDIAELKITPESIPVPKEIYEKAPDFKSCLPKPSKKFFAIFAAALLVSAAVIFAAKSLLHEKLFANPITVNFNDEYVGDYEYHGKIPLSQLKGFGGDVKITFEYEPCGSFMDGHPVGFVPVDGTSTNMINYLSTDNDPWADENGWIFLNSDYSSYSFTISREGIDSIKGDSFGFETFNMLVKSVTLEKGNESKKYYFRDYSEYNEEYEVTEEEGKKVVTVDIGKKMFLDTEEPVNRSSVPKAAFCEFDGDVLMTVEIEHIGTENFKLHIWNNGGLWQILDGKFSILEEVDRKNAQILLTMSDNGWIDFYGSLTSCSVIVPSEAVDRMSDGIFFHTFNISVKSVRLEDYESEE